MRIVKTVGRILQKTVIILLTFLLLSNLYMMSAKIILKDKSPTLFGFSWAVVLSGSMEPEISLDDLIISKEQDSYEVGDIITFESGKSFTTHRIVGKEEGGYITKGDANNTEDALPVGQENIVGKVFYTIPKIGLVLGYLKTPMGLMCMVLLGIMMIEVPYLWENRKNEQGKGCE